MRLNDNLMLSKSTVSTVNAPLRSAVGVGLCIPARTPEDSRRPEKSLINPYRLAAYSTLGCVEKSLQGVKQRFLIDQNTYVYSFFN